MNAKISISIALTVAALSPATPLAHAGDSLTDSMLDVASVTAVFDARSGILIVVGNDEDNVIMVTPTRDGSILVNGGEVPVVGGPAYLKNTDLVEIRGGAGLDILIATRMSAVLFDGGKDQDVIVWGAADGQATAAIDGDDLLMCNVGDGSDYEGEVDARDFNLWNSNKGSFVYEVSGGEDRLLVADADDVEPLMPIEIRELVIRTTVNDGK